MKRSIGVTICAVIAFLLSGVALFGGALMFFVVSLVQIQGNRPPFPEVTFFMGIGVGVLLIGFAAWGVAAGVGLLRHREWARVSMLVYIGLLLFLSFPGLFLSVVPIPIPSNAENSELFKQTLLSMRIFVAVFYGILILLSSFLLWFLNTRAIKDHFRDVNSPHVHPRPISISIIGWYLLTSVFLFPVIFSLHFPLFFFGFFLKGWSAAMIWPTMCLLQVIMGIGLLKLKAWARVISICYFAFFIFNSFAEVLIPGTQARFEEAEVEIQRILAIPPTALGTTPNQLHFQMWFGVVFSFLLFGIPLWFLIRTKRAFAPAPQPSD
jgi:hypothetical protein